MGIYTTWGLERWVHKYIHFLVTIHIGSKNVGKGGKKHFQVCSVLFVSLEKNLYMVIAVECFNSNILMFHLVRTLHKMCAPVRVMPRYACRTQHPPPTPTTLLTYSILSKQPPHRETYQPQYHPKLTFFFHFSLAVFKLQCILTKITCHVCIRTIRIINTCHGMLNWRCIKIQQKCHYFIIIIHSTCRT